MKNMEELCFVVVHRSVDMVLIVIDDSKSNRSFFLLAQCEAEANMILQRIIRMNTYAYMAFQQSD